MTELVHDLLVRGIAEAKAGEVDLARLHLQRMLRLDPSPEQQERALLWLSRISSDPAERRGYLERLLLQNPTHPAARRELAILEGRLDRDDIVDPDRISQETPDTPQPIESRRFVCHKCGGRMSFTPEGKGLECAYCGHRQTLLKALEQGAMVEEQDFTAALATARGHTQPVATQLLTCESCGASFTLRPEILSSNCPYCGSAHVVTTDSQPVIPPEAVVPVRVTREEARQAVKEWFAEEGLDVRAETPDGVYFPIWTFDISGEIPWQCLERVNDEWVPRRGSQVVYEDDWMVPASHALPAALTEVVAGFRSHETAPYEARYLADWPTETYQIPVSDASLVARWQILDAARTKIEHGRIRRTKDLTLTSTRFAIDSFKLLLVPLWIARYRMEGESFTVVINGRTGEITGERPPRGIRGWIARLFGG
jgi:DNA-directed RNA polymerase subunit RPC12/RpoP